MNRFDETEEDMIIKEVRETYQTVPASAQKPNNTNMLTSNPNSIIFKD